MTSSDDEGGDAGVGTRPRPRYDVYLGQTPGQTLGPFFHQGLLRTRSVFQVPGLCLDERDVFDAELAAPGAFGERIRIEGSVHDGLGVPIGDALLEAWQANGHGRYHHPLDPSGKEINSWKGSEDHFKNFIDACRSRRREDLHAEILEGHLSGALCHTGNISYRLGAKKEPEAIMEQIKGDRFAAESFGRMTEHLGKNGVDLKKDLLTIGPPLKFDPKAEKFIENDEANAMVKEKQREPYVVPEIVV